MPNWCENVVYFKHADRNMLDKLKNAFDAGNPFSTFVPIPEELRDIDKTYSANEDEMKECNEKVGELEKRYGYGTNYDFACGEWGTKWEPDDDFHEAEFIDDKEIVVVFNTAWSPPTAFYQHLIDDYGFKVTAYYEELGYGFVGCFENGEESCYYRETFDSIPVDIIENLGLDREYYESFF